MESAVREPITGVWGGAGAEPPAGPRGRAPGQGVSLKLKHFYLLDVHWKPQICTLF